MVRIFIVDEREVPDPDPSLTVEQVRDSLAEFFPELANATHTLTPRGQDQIVDFSRRVGDEGMTSAELVASLRTLPETRLALIQLARELVNARGELDEERAVARMDEIRDACREAQDYAEGTKRLRGSLQACLRDR